MSGVIHTIGYARATQDALVSALVAARIELLADVRALPLSRRAGFSKTSLKAAVEAAGMSYRHFRDLGTPKEGRDAARRGDYVTLQQVFAGQLELPEAMAQMAELTTLARERRTCLLCYCEEPDHCHRALLVDAAFEDWKRIDLHPGELPG
ncbi:MAG: DUF488 domain-containing protein [Erythrobacter sp.]|nr:MAG: DUF488 domain-containing protein [Erythrobacter sp.]